MPTRAERLERWLMVLDRKADNNTVKLDDTSSEIKSLRESFQFVQENIIFPNSELKETEHQILGISACLEKSQHNITYLEARSRRNTIRIVGLKEGSEC